MNFTNRSDAILRHQRTPVILSGRFTDIEEAPAGTVASPSFKLRLSPVAADREGEMTTRLWLGRISAFMRRHPALHGAMWGAGIATLLALLAIPLRDRLNDPLRRLRLTHRPFEARVVGLDYAPMRATRGAATDRGVEGERYGILSDLQARVDEDRSPENLQRLAKAHLAYAMPAEALALLEEAHRARPLDASILSNLAVAELASGRIADAAEHSAMALEYDPARAEAAFTWATAMERFSNISAAIEAWNRYLLIDPSSSWADEAHAHLDALRKPRAKWSDEGPQLSVGASSEAIHRLVARYPLRARLRITSTLLPQWVKTGDPALLALMHAIAAERAASDRFLIDVIEQASRSGRALQPGFDAWRSANESSEAKDYATAASFLALAARRFDAADSPLALPVLIQAASHAHYAGDSEAALRHLDAVDARLRSLDGRYPSMEGESGWIRGLVLTSGRSLAIGLQAWRTALEAARESGEIEQERAIQNLIAAALEASGDRQEADDARLRALSMNASADVDLRRLANAYADTSFGAHRAGRPFVARAFARAYMTVADEMNDDLERAFADLRRALAVMEIGHLEAAEQSLAAARTRAMSLRSPAYRERILGEADYAAGVVAQRRGRPSDAIASFTSAIELWERENWHIHSAFGYLARAEANRTLRNVRDAERDYRAGIEEMETQRIGFEQALSVSYFERADALFERLIDLLVEQGRPADALSVSERKRARVLLDRVAATEGAIPLDAEQVRQRVPAGAALIEVTLLEKTAEVWLVHGGRIEHVRRAVSRRDVEQAVVRHLQAINGDDEAGVRREGRWLYQQLFAPATSSLPADTTLIVIPDGALAACAFAALVTPDGRYLIDRFSLSSAPSASLALRPEPPLRRNSLLSVAQAAPRGMPRLFAAAGEAKDAARAHPNGRFVDGSAMTPEAFLDAAGMAAWVHFAGHAKTDVEHSSQSALLFESNDDAESVLTASRIGASHLPSAPFVVLAACSTGRGKLRRNEGTQSLAAAFLQAGARGVVATLWDVDDASSAKLFRAFHQHLREGARPADALRSAQRALLRSPKGDDRRPSVWASAVVEGTH